LQALGFNQRRQCILYLADQYLKERAHAFGRPFKRLSEVAETMLVHYGWPGGIAELAAVMKRADELSVGGTVEADALAFEIIFAEPGTYPREIRVALARTMQRVIVKALTLAKGDQGRAAKILGIDAQRLSQLTQLLKIHTVWQKPEE
jgi:DNA-binding NtrC family response regulator